MTATNTPAHTAPACRIDEHAECLGPGETRLAWQTPTQPAIETQRCACTDASNRINDHCNGRVLSALCVQPNKGYERPPVEIRG
ncbi:hypothetical protein [Streptomyces sp. NPDC087525]|uniref:hypothetical protein n=1 Tax=Streptomyces sp. NPDC087525 TaxID=3365793 RepID=UPI00381E06DE